MSDQPSRESEPLTLHELLGGCGPVRVALVGVPGERVGGGVRPVAEVGTDDGEGGVDAVPLGLFLHARAMFACGSHVMKLKEYLPRLIFQCPGCGRKLAEEPGEPRRFELEAESLDHPPVRVRLDAPAVACPGCGRPNVLWSDARAAEVEAAIADALGGATGLVVPPRRFP